MNLYTRINSVYPRYSKTRQTINIANAASTRVKTLTSGLCTEKKSSTAEAKKTTKIDNGGV